MAKAQQIVTVQVFSSEKDAPLLSVVYRARSGRAAQRICDEVESWLFDLKDSDLPGSTLLRIIR